MGYITNLVLSSFYAYLIWIDTMRLMFLIDNLYRMIILSNHMSSLTHLSINHVSALFVFCIDMIFFY
jgi:hypothetical protein